MMVSFMFLMLGLLCFCSLVQTEIRMNRSHQGALITKEDCRLGGHVITSSSSLSFISCAQACLSHSRCISTNFRAATSSTEASCDLSDDGITWTDDSILEKAKGFVFSQYKHIKIETGCEQSPCLNGGSCGLDETAGTFVCFCTIKWKGERCEQMKKDLLLYRFTNLRTTGRKGPTSDADYQGTSLEGQVQVHRGLQKWSVPVTGLYQFEACGASGGNGLYPKIKGGRGAKVTGDVLLRQGTTLEILVGQRGDSLGGGGGGTFLVLADGGIPLVIAGGGGGGDYFNGDPGQFGEEGSVNGGAAGGGGMVCIPGMKTSMRGFGGGGGWNESGLCYEGKVCVNTFCEDGGKSFLSGGAGGREINANCMGGFGGGGTCGGGGGYSGGGVEYDKRMDTFQAGGGGSYKRDSLWLVTQDCKRGHGYIEFKILT